jgi:hypothetical protein
MVAMRRALITVGIASALAAATVLGFLWLHSKGAFQSGGESIDPPAFRERPFNRRLWRSTDPYVPAGRYNPRGTMLDDLLRVIRPGMMLSDARFLLGPPDQRRDHVVYWLTGGYHGLDESCLALAVNPGRRIDRVAIIDMTNEPALAKGDVDEWCPHGVALRPQSN